MKTFNDFFYNYGFFLGGIIGYIGYGFFQGSRRDLFALMIPTVLVIIGLADFGR